MNLFQFAVDMATEQFATATDQEREELARDVAIDDSLRDTMLRLVQRFWDEGRFSVSEVISIRRVLAAGTRYDRHPIRGADGYWKYASLEQKAATLVLIEEIALSALTLAKMSAQ